MWNVHSNVAIKGDWFIHTLIRPTFCNMEILVPKVESKLKRKKQTKQKQKTKQKTPFLKQAKHIVAHILFLSV